MISDLSRQAAEAEIQAFLCVGDIGNPALAEPGSHVQSALDAQAAQYREVIKVATDALGHIQSNDPEDNRQHADTIANAALRRIAELTPKP